MRGPWSVPTNFNGVDYRSRTEARWAHFFQSLNIDARYEDEAYETPDGRYLPDFRVWSASVPILFEVKGAEPSDSEKRKLRYVAEHLRGYGVIAVGPPRWHSDTGSVGELLCYCPENGWGRSAALYGDRFAHHPTVSLATWEHYNFVGLTEAAGGRADLERAVINAARARFW